MRESLTNRQKETLQFIKQFIAKYGYSPSVREICKGLNLNSPATVFAHIKKLEEKKYVKQEKDKFRTLEVLVDNEYLNNDDSIVKVPLLGKVAAGNPIEAISNPNEFTDLPAFMIPKNEEVFTLEVSGNSMINVGIYDNDILIVKKTNVARNGQIVVALTEENETTVKTFYKESDHIRLQPENDNLKPIILNNCTILGKVIGLYRKF